MGQLGERDYRYYHRTQPRARGRTIMEDDTVDWDEFRKWDECADERYDENDAMQDMEAMRREIALLRAELAAAREDTARLDWIFEVGWAEQRYGDTLLQNRAQIDAARKREEETP